jgi:cation transport ATPase
MGKTGKIVTYILWALLIVSTVLLVSLMVNISEQETDPAMLGWIDTNLVWAYILVAVGAGIAILSGLFNMFTDKSAAKKGLISIGFLAVVAIIAYTLASPVMPQFPGIQKAINDGLTTSTVKLVDAGLIATYILLGLAILAIAVGPIMRLFR